MLLCTSVMCTFPGDIDDSGCRVALSIDRYGLHLTSIFMLLALCISTCMFPYVRGRTHGGQYAERDRLPLLFSTPSDTRTIKLCAATMYCVQQEQSPFRVTRTIQLPLLSSTPTDTRTIKLCAATMYCVEQVAEPIQWPSEPPAARTDIWMQAELHS